MKMLPPHVLNQFAEIVGSDHALSGADETAAYFAEPRGLFRKDAALVLRPKNADEVADIVRLANQTGTAIIPQGGNTGLVGGQVPTGERAEILVSMSRLSAIREVNTVGDHILAEAGATLAAVQEAADRADRLFPLTLASEGSCQIGGTISTNAGGTAVLAYGNMRDMVLGLEVVLANGQVWNGLRTLRKDNTGYDLKHLFIGAEGTLGIITAATLKLFPKPRGRAVAFCGLDTPAAALALYRLARNTAMSGLTAFEIIPRVALDMVFAHAPGSRDPLAGKFDWYVLTEIVSNSSDEHASASIEEIFMEGVATGLIGDAVRAESLQQASALWRLRHAVSEVQRHEGGSIKHDVAVPVASVPELLERGIAAVSARIPGIRPVAFGHLGDGNIHFNLSQPVGMDKAAFLSMWDEVSEIIHGIVVDLGGSIAAEHGIGQLKRKLLPSVKAPAELETMRVIKAALDPNNVLNPGKVL